MPNTPSRTFTLLAPPRRRAAIALIALALSACAEVHLVPVDDDAGIAPDDAGGPCRLATDDAPWTFTGGPGGAIVDALAYDGRTFVAVRRGAVFHATDVEGPWTPAPSAGDLGMVPSIVSVGPGRGFVAVTETGVIRSLDGATWQRTSAGMEGAKIVRVSATEDGPLAIATREVYQLREDERWSRVLDTGEHELLEAHRFDHGWMGLTTSLLIVRFKAEGAERVETLPIAMDLQPRGDATFVLDTSGRVHRTDDGGNTWTTVAHPAESLARGLVRTDDGALLVLELGGRIHRSTDGATFARIEDFATGPITAWSTEPGQRFVATGGGGFVLADGPRIGTSVDGVRVTESVSRLPGMAQTLACTDAECVAIGEGGRVYVHDGEGWIDRGLVDDTASVTAAARIGDELWLGTGYRGVYRLSATGFEPLTNGLPRIDGSIGSQVAPITGLARFGGAVFASTATSGVWRLMDHADSWEPINGGIPIASRDGFGRPRRSGLLALQAGSGRLVTGGERVYHLDPGTGRWVEASTPSDGIVALTASEAGFFALTGVGREPAPRLLRSTDGRLYEPVALPAAQARHVIAFGDELWIAGADGVFRSRDRGDTFARIEDGLAGGMPHPYAAGALAVSSDALWIGTVHGVHRRSLTCEVQR